MSLKNYIFSSVNTKGGQDSDKFATIRIKSHRRKKMTAINEENGATNATVASDTAAPPPPSAQTVTVSTNGVPPKSDSDENSKVKRLIKLWTYISVEPLMLCWLLPSCFLFIAVENLALEKVRTVYIAMVPIQK